MKKTVTYVLVTLLAVAVGMGGVYLIKQLSSSKKPVEPQDAVQSLSDEKKDIVEYEMKNASSPDSPAIIEKQEGLKDKTKETLSVDNEANIGRDIEVDSREMEIDRISDDYFRISGLKALNVSNAGARFVLSDSEKHYYKSEDGSFPRVAANSKGYYAVAAIDNATGVKSKVITIKTLKRKDDVIVSTDVRSGSETQEFSKLSSSELSSLLNQGDASVLKSVYNRFANYRTCKVQSNIPGVTTLSGVCMQVNMEGKKAVVNSLQYDKSGRVTGVNVSLE